MVVVQPAHGSAKSVAKCLYSLGICSLLMTSTVSDITENTTASTLHSDDMIGLLCVPDCIFSPVHDHDRNVRFLGQDAG